MKYHFPMCQNHGAGLNIALTKLSLMSCKKNDKDNSQKSKNLANIFFSAYYSKPVIHMRYRKDKKNDRFFQSFWIMPSIFQIEN